MADDVRQVVILTVGVAWSAEYEIDAHMSAARVVGLPDRAIEAIVQGAPQAGSDEAAVAYRLTNSLLIDHVVPDRLYRDAIATFAAARSDSDPVPHRPVPDDLLHPRLLKVPVPERSDARQQPEPAAPDRVGEDL